MKRGLFILLFLFLNLLYGQITYQKPDTNLILRANNQFEVASLLIDSDVAFFEKAKKELINGYQVYHLEIQVPDAKYLNIYFDVLKINQNSVLEIYNNQNDLVLNITSSSNPGGKLYAIRPIKGDKIKFVYKGSNSNSKVVIGQVGYFWKSFEGISSSGYCEVDVNCSEGEKWEDEKNGIVRLLLKRSSSSIYCSGTLINNTSRDCRPFILTAEHCAENVTKDGLNQSIAFFNYEKAICNAGNANSDNTISGMTLRASTSFSNGSDIMLLELNEEIPPEYNPYYNGWNKLDELFLGGGVSIHHPKGDVKKISTYQSDLITADDSGINDNAFWQVNWVKTENGHGVTEVGSSGAPVFNNEKLVVGALSVGTSYCSSPEDPDFYGKVSYSWNYQLDSSKRLDVWLDPLETSQEHLSGSYFPCDDTAKYYVPIDSMSIELNPSSDRISLYVEQSVSNSIKIFLYDVSGKVILSREEATSNVTLVEIPTINIRDGLYFLVVHAGKRERIFKVIVAN